MPYVWITGACGFIGRHLARQLSDEGHLVAGIGHGHWPLSDASKWGIKQWVNGELEAANFDELALLCGLPETVFHLAGGSAVGASFSHPLEDFNRTVVATARLLDWVRRNAPRTTIVCASSAAVYGAGYISPIHETSVVNPFSPYGFHKAMMETLCQLHSRSFGGRSVIVRLFSVYGAGIRKQLLWDLCVKLRASGKLRKVILGGTGDEIRDWIHIDDVTRLLVRASMRAPEGESVFNGGTGVGMAVREIANMVVTAWGGGVDVEFSGQKRPGDPDYLVADVQHCETLGYKSSVSVREALTDYVEWFRRAEIK